MKKETIYSGDVEITSSNYKQWEEKLSGIEKIIGALSISSNSSLKADSLKTVGGDLYIHTKLEEKLEKRLWKNNRNNKLILNQNSSEFLISQEGNIEYQINNVYFSKELFDDVRLGKLSAEKVFSLSNIEQRRVAYELMDKMKMKSLPGFKTLDEVVDKYGNKMRIISFTINGFSTPFKYLNCFCPSTKREYFIETKQDKCKFAKAKSFGLDAISFDEEW